MHIQYAIIDLDHTLIHSHGIEDTWERSCVEHGLDGERARREFEDYRGRPLEQTLAVMGVTDPAEADVIIDSFWGQYDVGVPDRISGADILLSGLAQRNIQLFLSTGSSPRVATQVLQLTGWHTLFSLVLGTDRAMMKGPQHYDAIQSHLGISPADFAKAALSLGDGTMDMQYATDEGLQARCGFADNNDQCWDALVQAGATHRVDRLGDLLWLIDGYVWDPVSNQFHLVS